MNYLNKEKYFSISGNSFNKF